MSGQGRPVVLVTPRSFGRGDEALRRRLAAGVARVEWRQDGPLGRAELQRLVADVDGWIAGVESIDADVLAAAGRLKVIARYGVGVDNVDLDAAFERGITVTNTPGANAGAVAELVLGAMLALARRIPQADRAVRQGAWPRVSGVALEGKVVGLLGLGAIGCAVASRAVALGCVVRAHDPAPVAAQHAARLRIELVDRDPLVAGSDFVSLHVPVLPQTHRMVDASFLARMKPGAFLVNAARGELVDELALAEALREGRLAGAALDVFADEPLPGGSPLVELDSVVLTPHIGAHTDLAARAMGRGAVDNCLAVLRGEPAPNPVLPPIVRSR